MVDNDDFKRFKMPIGSKVEFQEAATTKIVRKRATQKKSRRTSSRNCHSIISTSSCRQPGSRKSLRNRPYQKASPNQSLLIIMFSRKHTFGNFFSVLLFKLSYKQIHRSDSVKIKFQIGANICSSLN